MLVLDVGMDADLVTVIEQALDSGVASPCRGRAAAIGLEGWANGSPYRLASLSLQEREELRCRTHGTIEGRSSELWIPPDRLTVADEHDEQPASLLLATLTCLGLPYEIACSPLRDHRATLDREEYQRTTPAL